MDRLDRIINRIALAFHEARRQDAVQKRQAHDAESEARRRVDQIADRIALSFPIKSHEECPTLSDQQYVRYRRERELHRHHMLLATIAALGSSEPDEYPSFLGDLG